MKENDTATTQYSCDLIQDLIPLYCDEVCSEDSAKAVEEHIENCETCKNICDTMKKPDVIQETIHAEKYEEQQLTSIKKIQKKWKKHGLVFGIVGIILGGILVVLIFKFLMFLGIFGLLAWDSANQKVKVYEDIANYQNYFGEQVVEEFSYKWLEDTIFPPEIKQAMNVQEFKAVYYNPWDAQYLSYLTVEYSEEDYEKELARLEQEGMEAYKGYYSVTDEPDGYDIVAMDSHEAYGFVYAMIPEDDSTTITYVEIIFANFFLDLDINEYIPEKYILEGFDASEDSPHRDKLMEKLERQGAIY